MCFIQKQNKDIYISYITLCDIDIIPNVYNMLEKPKPAGPLFYNQKRYPYFNYKEPFLHLFKNLIDFTFDKLVLIKKPTKGKMKATHPIEMDSNRKITFIYTVSWIHFLSAM